MFAQSQHQNKQSCRHAYLSCCFSINPCVFLPQCLFLMFPSILQVVISIIIKLNHPLFFVIAIGLFLQTIIWLNRTRNTCCSIVTVEFVYVVIQMPKVKFVIIQKWLLIHMSELGSEILQLRILGLQIFIWLLSFLCPEWILIFLSKLFGLL